METKIKNSSIKNPSQAQSLGDLTKKFGGDEYVLDIPSKETLIEVSDLSVKYGKSVAIKDVSFKIPRNSVVAIIGPSGCGKSTLLRAINRMNELIPKVQTTGSVRFGDEELYSKNIDPTVVRFNIGMVFQRPNPFPQSVYNNVAFGPRINGMKKGLKERVERSLKRAALWDEVSTRLTENGLALSGGQQQRLCIARALAVEPSVILMDEPASALDPISTQKIEDLILELKKEVTIVIVTHNMQQAARISDYVAMMMVNEERIGNLVEYGENAQIFGNPKHPQTNSYVTGRIG